MIDTIIIRLHNLEKYNRLIRLLETINNNGITTETGIVDRNEMDKLHKKGYKSAKQKIDILKIRRTGDFLVKTRRGSKNNSSGHYEFSYLIDLTQDHLEINFSIPKYVYGMNVLMYVEHRRDRDYKYFENNLLEYNISKAPELLIAFLNNFLKIEFIDKIDLEDVEINRIDVCFNQVFKTRAEALYYLEYQKKLRKKHCRVEGGLPIDYGTSLMHSTKRNSVKIYHKGSEYRVNDLKHHKNINEEKGNQYFKTDKISELADKILRYEVTIRRAELNYLFKHNIFRKNCKLFKIDYTNYLRIFSTMQRNGRISKIIGTLGKEDKEIYRKLHPYERISKNDRQNYKYIPNLMEKSPKFMLKENLFSAIYNSETLIAMDTSRSFDPGTALFSKELIALCLNKLMDFINEFQLKELPD